MVVIDRVDVLDETVARLNGWDRGFPHTKSKTSETNWSDAVDLPEPSECQRNFWEVQRLRRSVHGYQKHPIPLADAVAVCEAAHDPDAETEILLVVRDVKGVEPGLYAYDGERLGLLEAVPADSTRREEWFLQREFAAAPAVLVLVSSVAACGGSMHAYRQMMVHVGEQCQDAALAAVGVGLGGVIFAGLLMVGLLDLGIDGFQRTGVVGYAFGYPLDAQRQ